MQFPVFWAFLITGGCKKEAPRLYQNHGTDMAADLGFEPRHTESESAVLPLHKSATARDIILTASENVKGFCKKIYLFFVIAEKTVLANRAAPSAFGWQPSLNRSLRPSKTEYMSMICTPFSCAMARVSGTICCAMTSLLIPNFTSPPFASKTGVGRTA